ncbi:aspartyl/asparaginyl beta-hydroxylase domain-containing protein [Brevundimonas sp. Root1423]|uniref:aspartyl/asparaginyl beta-hydroxylase domain-containing protein n=1 Tax=Brevundimonas sp. Root1423 TaxID=1736462 RepID=UPI000AB0AA2D|nr:aspartyl/asparaginyl beta-hydroxylase domain-containing protein [Brevundimonas sp. Root1423]
MTQDGPQAELLRRAAEALARRDPQSALGLLDQADRLGVTHNGTLNRALALRLIGDFNGALVVLDDALAMQPYDFTALLGKAAMLEKIGQGVAAVDVYRNALKIAPPRERCPPPVAAQMDHADGVVRRHAEALRDHMRNAVAGLRDTLDPAALDRFDEGLEIYAGLKTAPKQEPLLLDYPRLPAIPFYDRALFPWLEQLEAATPVIQAELEALLASSMDEFAPYIAYPKGAPVNQWGELNHSRKWSSLWLWRDGARQEAVCERCPRTAALLESLPMCRQEGFAPTAVFSALQPHTHIPAHTGSSNVRLLTHLPLILPGPARFRVGNTVRDWKMGEAWVFDDTIEHEAWNDADQMRVILIFDIWNPWLTDGEKTLITAMMKAQRSFTAAG